MSENAHIQTAEATSAQPAPVSAPATPASTPAPAAPASAPAAAKPASPAPTKTANPAARSEPAGRSSQPTKPVVTDRQQPTEQAAASTTGAPTKPQESPEERKARLEDQLAQRGRELATMRAQTEQMNRQLQELQAYKAQQTKLAEAQKLKRWDPRHPENSKFSSLRQRIEQARADVRGIQIPNPPEGLAPEQAQAWKEAFAQGVKQQIAARIKPEEWDEYAAWEQDKAEFDARMHADPAGTMRDIVRAEVQAGLQQARQAWEAEQAVNQDLSDPELGPLMEEHGDQMREVIGKLGDTDEAYEVARHMMRLFGQNKALKAQLAEQSQQIGSAEAKVSAANVQQAAIKRRASEVVAPSVKAPQPRSVWEEAKEWADKNGHSTDSQAFIQKVTTLTQNRFKNQ